MKISLIPYSWLLGGAIFISALSFANGQNASVTRVTTVESAPAQPLAFSVVGRAVVQSRPDLEVVYTLASTAPVTSRAANQKIRLAIEETGLRDVTLDDGQTVQRQGSSSRNVSINTGKFKTVGQLNAMVAGIFRRFLALDRATVPNQELGKIGDVRYGGELRFMAESPKTLRFDYEPRTAPDRAIRFSRADVQAFLGLLER
jgi:hypothetical protein